MTRGSLSIGKVDPKILREVVFNHLGISNSQVIIGPKIGEDAAIIDFKDRILVIHSDPITGSVKNIGRLAINICSNDIACRGVAPKWILVALLLPPNFDYKSLEKIVEQMDEAAKKLGISIIGGHTEVTTSITRPIIVATAIGEAAKGKFVTTSGSKKGDCIIVTKGTAIEGTAILSTEMDEILQNNIEVKLLQRAKDFIGMTSVLKEALIAMKIGKINAMHDATEGGIAGALQELALASDIGMLVYEEKIPIHEETKAICNFFKIDPLKTISSGTLIISCHMESAEKIVNALRKEGIIASIVGETIEKERGSYIVRSDGSKLDLSNPVIEEIWQIFESYKISY